MIEELTKACVHCGFCLPTCPTYVLWSEEMDSPRGRIQLMEKTAQGTLRLGPTVVEHFDRCLGCMACISSCPSGVRYDLLIEQTLQRLLELRYLDDEAFAKAKAGSLARQGFGPRAITARLAQAGVRGEAASAGLLRAVEPGEAELATSALEKRLKGRAFSSLDQKEKLRLQRWLVGRGFSGSAIRAACGRSVEGDPFDPSDPTL